MDKNPFTEEQTAAIKSIMHDALNDYFLSKGKMSKNLIIGTAVIIGSLTVILGGFKAILGWLGFAAISK